MGMFSKKQDNKISILANDQKLASVTDSHFKQGGVNDPPLLIQDENLIAYNNSLSSN
jgi:hypothetical protein